MDEPKRGLRAAGVLRNRASILASARRHLVETGFHRLGLEQVAADAGVTRATIYRQFTNKLGLLDALAEDLAARSGLVPRMAAALATPDPAAALVAMAAELCRFWGTDPDVFRRLIGLAAVDPEAHRVLSGREQWRYRQVATLVTRLDAAGRLRPEINQEHAVAAIGAVTGFPACDELAARAGLDHDRIDRLVLALLGGIVRVGCEDGGGLEGGVDEHR
ncbi:TetR/AcrR family transcriptional regulator [Pseudonocardia acaciae]|uniref:TetR/AcrR family transcriptional regulator n=1 Tax=Pseudonocardia acaciae TaxID=551276 RepID=UPI000683D6A3|nr:TetR/AcrR family transcriptional regulator [Pseudonocardia acaciae]